MAPVMRGLPVLLACALGCDALVEQSHRGTPLASARTVVANESGQTPAHPRAAVFWAKDLETVDIEEMQEQTSSSQPVRDGAGYVIHLFEQPAPLLAWDARQPDGPKFAIGRVVVYDDLNRNARRDPDEPVVGGLGPYAAIYAPELLPAGLGPSRRDVPPGLHFTWLPLTCRPDPAPTDAVCDTPLGDACHAGECGAGECVDRFNFPWPLGACLVNAASGCVPEEGALLHGGPGGPYFARACDDDRDCGRDAPYRCDPLQGACVPFNVPRVALGALTFTPFCAR